ncbi:MAG: DUF975 family protein [Lachnospiraceae bacterium]|nr:DUF975 family protein [Lachnospiraceae bacterium]
MIMWRRETLKDRAKVAFKGNYWRCVVVALVLSLLMQGTSRSTSNDDSSTSVTYDDYYEYDESYFEDIYNNIGIEVGSSGGVVDFLTSGAAEQVVNSAFSGLPLLFRTLVSLLLSTAGLVMTVFFLLVALALEFLVTPVLEIGGCRFFVKNSENTFADSVENLIGDQSLDSSSEGDGGSASGRNSKSLRAHPSMLLTGFVGGYYWSLVKTQFLRKLYTFLWTLLLVIPGIVKSYEYCMIPYLLADFPDMEPDVAFSISRTMMDGNKLETFILDLSFIAWELLSSVTLGIVGVFYVNPYEYATKAELYRVLKNEYFSGRENG